MYTAYDILQQSMSQLYDIEWERESEAQIDETSII